MTAPTMNVEGFSLSHAQILDGTETFSDALARTDATDQGWDIYGVREASLDVDDDDWSNEGDDDVLSRWQWINYAELEVVTGYFGFKTYERITKRTTVTSGSGVNITYRADLWHEDDNNLPPFPMLLKMPSKDAKGATRALVVGLYRFQPGPISFEGPEYKEGFSVSYNGTGLKTLYDEAGVAFSDGKKRCGAIISTPS